MKNIDRRRLFKLTGVGTVLLAGTALPVVGKTLGQRSDAQQSDVYNFRGSLGLPEQPLPSYATYLIEGTVNLAKGTGLLTSRVMAGHPDAHSEIGLPGLGRIIRVVGVDQLGSTLNVHGIIEDRSQVQPGESSHVELVIDRSRGTVQAPFIGKTVTLALA